MMTQNDKIDSLENFVLKTMNEGPSEQNIYGYIARFSKEHPDWRLFLVYDDVNGEKFCGGHYPLNATEIINLTNLFSIFADLKKTFVIDTKAYFL